MIAVSSKILNKFLILENLQKFSEDRCNAIWETLHKSEKNFHKIEKKNTKTFVFENFQEFQLQNAVEMRILCIFEDRQRNISESPLCHKMEISFKQNFEKIAKNKNFYFWKLSGMSTSKWWREVGSGYF